jgi:glutathione S-transferase
MTSTGLTLFGRSSSSFTRVARIFAAELGVAYDFEILRDLQTLDVASYAGNPALKIPSLRTPSATWFGAQNVCRELERIAGRKLRVVWSESFEQPVLANAHELAMHAMSTNVNLIMSGMAGTETNGAHRTKMDQSLRNTLTWLDAQMDAVLAALPSQRELSFLEVCLYCLVTHLEFRQVLPTAPYPALAAFARGFGERSSCQATPFRFDNSPR